MISNENRDLLARALADELSPAEAQLLLIECRRDPELLEQFSRIAVTDRLLAYAHLYSDDAAFTREVRERLKTPAKLPSNVIPRVNWWKPVLPWAAAAALVVALVCLALFFPRQGPESQVRIARMEAVTAPLGAPPLQTGHTLPARRFQFNSGLLELQFLKGATVILEGPVDFEVISPLECILHQGKAVARVSEAGHGFAVNGPRGRMVDLGTEFAVSVSRSGDTEVHVLNGRVEASPKDGAKPLELAANQALRLTSSRTESMPMDAGVFVTDMPPGITGPIGYVHWPFDEGQGRTSANAGEGLVPKKAPATLLSFNKGKPGPKWVPGQFGQGLSLNGDGDYVECDYIGIGGGQPRTVAFWVKVPVDLALNEADAIINWGTDQPALKGSVWRISINNNPEMNSEWGGPLGRLRVGVGGGFVVGTTDLRDDRWHHCAVVLYGGERPDTGNHVLIYIDGQLEPAARKKVFPVSTDVEHATAHNIWIGRNLSYREAGQQVLGGAPFFRGCVDEVFVFNAALPQEQIISLMKYNRLQPVPLVAANIFRP
jgi:hypothetical protein